MKKALFLLLILILVLLAGCGSGEAKEPVPEWPDRITGEYDDALTFTYQGAEPTAAGADSITGRMTALFSLEDGGTLALGWRQLRGAEVELLVDFLAEGGGITGVWAADSSAPSAAECYVSLEGRWFCLSASCPGMDREALLALLDGTVSAAVRDEQVWPRLTGETWVSQLPWEEDWTCLDLGTYELEPESGKEALRGLLSAYSWTLAEPEAEEAEPVPEHDLSVIPRVRQTILWTESGKRLRFHLRRNGDIWWNGALWRPAGADAGEKLLADWSALRDTGIPTESPPPLTYSCGEQTLTAHIAPTYTWHYVTRSGEDRGAESDGDLYENIDWLDGTRPILRAEGVVRLSFPTREPDSMTLSVFTGLGKAPVDLRDGGFIPYSGINAYVLGVRWEKADRGGSGSANYILLINGDGPAELPEPEARVSGSILEADAYGCIFTLENREDRDLSVPANQSTWQSIGINAYSLFRRTPAGGWEWVQPIRFMEERGCCCPAGESITRGLDWSYDFGTLEPGEYTLLLSCHTLEKYRSRREYLYLPLSFTLEEDSLPEAPGPGYTVPVPADIQSTVTNLSQRRFYQTLRNTGKDPVYAERDFTLFRKEDDGTLTYIPPKYHLPSVLNDEFTLTEGSSGSIVIDWAAYGTLDRGAYVLRRRLYTPEAGEDMTGFDQSWRTQPEERIRYLDTLIFLNAVRRVPDHGVEPMTISPYAGEETELPMTVKNPQFRTDGCRFRLENLGDRMISFNTDSALLYFYSGGEWLPLEMNRHPANGLLETGLAAGEGRELSFTFIPTYASLTKGIYRLVLPLTAEGEQSERSWLAVEFTIRADGTGTFNGMLLPAEKAVQNYSLRLAERYSWPEELTEPGYFWPHDGIFPNRNFFRLSNDLYVYSWGLKRRSGQLVVTVYRDRDVQRAKALLAEYENVEVVRGTDGTRKVSSVTEANAGTLGTLRAEVLEQTDPELYREGTWLLSLEVTREGVELEPNWLRAIYPEVWDEEAGKWYSLDWEYGYGGLQYHTYSPMEPGVHPIAVVSLGFFRYTFRPGEQYRFVLAGDVLIGNSEKLEYYTCPFTVNEPA